MLDWKINKNVIAELYYKDRNIINPWGFETADSSAFFSLEKGVGYRYTRLKEKYFHDDRINKAEIENKMKEGQWNLLVEDKICNNSILRKAEITTLEDSVFMDFVMRFRFKKDIVNYVEIANKRFYHKNTNIYNQYPVDKVSLKCNSFNINITIIDKFVPDKLEPVIYVRDHHDEWVVHIRMIPKNWDKEVIKVCTSWAKTRPLPQFISKFLLSFKSIKKALWYRGEKRPFKSGLVRKFLNPAAFGMVNIQKGTKLMWNVEMEIV